MSRNAMRKSINNITRSKGFEEYLDILKAKREQKAIKKNKSNNHGNK